MHSGMIGPEKLVKIGTLLIYLCADVISDLQEAAVGALAEHVWPLLRRSLCDG